MKRSRKTITLRALLPLGALVFLTIPASPAQAEATFKAEPGSGAAGTSVRVEGKYTQAYPAPLQDIIQECVSQTYQWDNSPPFTFFTSAGKDAGKCEQGAFFQDFHPQTRTTVGTHSITVTLEFRDGSKQTGKTSF